MRKVTRDDIRSVAEYEAIREGIRAQIIALKRRRRVPVGQLVTLVFENRETVIFQVQEMMRAEHIADPRRIQEEIDVYNGLIPVPGELSATLFIEIPDQDRLRAELPKLIGIDEAVALCAGGRTVCGVSQGGRSTAEKTATVHYVRFPFRKEDRAAFLGGAEVWLVIDHPNYGASARLSEETKSELARDIAEARPSSLPSSTWRRPDQRISCG